MAFYERWREQHDADKYFEELGFKERLIHGIRIYYNEDTGESLDLYRPKQIYLKTIQKSIFLSEGMLERLVEDIKGLSLDEKSKEALRKAVMREKNTLNELLQEINVKGNN